MKPLDYLFAARPMLQVPIWTVYLVSLLYHNRLSGHVFDWVDLLNMAGISLIFSAASYLNQIHDFDSDLINKKVGFLQRGLLRENSLSMLVVPLAIVALAISAFISFYLLFIYAQFVYLAFTYSVPPLRLKDRPLGGLLANAYGHGLLVTMSVLPNMTVHNAGELGWDSPFYFFFAVGATYLMTTLPDIKGDRLAGKRTLAVVLGPLATKLIALVFTLFSAYIAYYSEAELLLYVALIAALLTLLTIVLKSELPVHLAAKVPLLLLTLIACYYYPYYLLFLVALIFSTRIYYRKRFGLTYPKLLS